MEKLKRVLSKLVAQVIFLFLVMSFATTTANAASPKQFTDIAADSPANTVVSYLTENGVISGCGNKTFRPDDEITTAEFICMLERAFGSTDRIPGDWDWTKYSSEWYDQAAVIMGSFAISNPTDKCIEGSFAAKCLLSILGEGVEDLNVCVSALKYKGAILSECTEYVLTGALRGYIPWQEKYESSGGFNMNSAMTRIEAATMVYMALQQVL